MRKSTLGLLGGASLAMEGLPITAEFEMSDESPKIHIGTRGSELALVQATATEAALAAMFPDLPLERVIIKTTGDRRKLRETEIVENALAAC